MNTAVKEQVRAAGYEALYILGGFLAVAARPTMRTLDDVTRWIDESHSRRELVKRLHQQGMVEFEDRGGRWVPLLTQLGRSALAGGRLPEEAWDRPWDERWRLLTFDLPREQRSARMKLRRWLCERHFGRLQGSVWICPDPVEGIDDWIRKHEIDPTSMIVFEGSPAGEKCPREIAALAWRFDEINERYREYTGFADRILRNLERAVPGLERFQGILREDRERWREAVRDDPLLPRSLHPKGYAGPRAWKRRAKMLKTLRRSLLI